MDQHSLALLCEKPEWISVLEAYRQAEAEAEARILLPQAAPPAADQHAAAPAGQPESKAPRELWVRRIGSAPGVPAEDLSRIHGRLIAEGLLQCDVLGRDEGMGYRLTRDARRALDALHSGTAVVLDEAGEEAATAHALDPAA